MHYLLGSWDLVPQGNVTWSTVSHSVWFTSARWGAPASTVSFITCCPLTSLAPTNGVRTSYVTTLTLARDLKVGSSSAPAKTYTLQYFLLDRVSFNVNGRRENGLWWKERKKIDRKEHRTERMNVRMYLSSNTLYFNDMSFAAETTSIHIQTQCTAMNHGRTRINCIINTSH